MCYLSMFSHSLAQSVGSRSLSFSAIELKQFLRHESDLSQSRNIVLTVLLLHLFLKVTSKSAYENVRRMHGLMKLKIEVIWVC